MDKVKKGFWENAFKITDEPLSEEEGTWLDSISQALLKRGLKMPAILFLETTKPLHFLAGQAVRFLDPVFSTVVPQSKLKRLTEVLEKRNAVERMISFLESHGSK